AAPVKPGCRVWGKCLSCNSLTYPAPLVDSISGKPVKSCDTCHKMTMSVLYEQLMTITPPAAVAPEMCVFCQKKPFKYSEFQLFHAKIEILYLCITLYYAKISIISMVSLWNRISSDGKFESFSLDKNFLVVEKVVEKVPEVPKEPPVRANGPYLFGKKHGEFANVDDNFNLISKENYTNGLLDGECTYFNKNVKYLTQIYDKGQLIVESNYVDGVLHGAQTTFHNNLPKIVEKYEKGILMNYLELNNEQSVVKDYYYLENSDVRVFRLIDEKGRDNILGAGETYGYKACVVDGDLVCVKLKILADAKRVTPVDKTGDYLSRVDQAFVEQIVDLKGNEYKEAQPLPSDKYQQKFILGTTVKVDDYNSSALIPRALGIELHKFPDQCEPFWLKSLTN
ncbi:MAG: hypothetical protein Harvfovirus68_9, partial [Harvfovirus sp.]